MIFFNLSPQLDYELPEGRSCVCNTTSSSELAPIVSQEMFQEVMNEKLNGHLPFHPGGAWHSLESSLSS